MLFRITHIRSLNICIESFLFLISLINSFTVYVENDRMILDIDHYVGT